MQFFDSHAHLTSDQLYPDCEALLARATSQSVTRIVNICTNAVTLQRGLELGKRYPWVVNAAATTPHDVEKEGEELFPLMAKHAYAGDLVAVGESGLDYYYEHSNREVQRSFLKRYLHLARECQLPIIIHCREAFDDLFTIFDSDYQGGAGVLHCFTGTPAEANEVLRRGFYLSLSGIVTFKKSSQLQEVAKSVPLDRLLIETDAPYLAPEGHRGKPNEPSFLPSICQFVAKLRGVSPEIVAQATWDNANRLFSIL